MKETLKIMMIAFAIAQPLAAQGACKPILDAEMKALETPVHLFITSDIGSRTITAEAIYANGHSYVKAGGNWTINGTTKAMADLMQKKRQQHSSATCSYVKDDSVNGEAAAVYNMKSELSSGGELNSQVWISKSKSVPLRQEDVVDSHGHKTHNSTRYEYNNVEAPM
jgi:hypothetical protein